MELTATIYSAPLYRDTVIFYSDACGWSAQSLDKYADSSLRFNKLICENYLSKKDVIETIDMFSDDEMRIKRAK